MKYWTKGLFIFLGIWFLLFWTLAPEPAVLIHNNWSFVILGFFGAILGNLSAVGGGIVFIPAILLIFHLPPLTALKVSLASQSVGMSSGALAWMQRTKLPLHLLKITLPGLLMGSLVSSLLIHPSGLLVKLLFGPVSISLGVLTLWSLRHSTQKSFPSLQTGRAKTLLLLVSCLGGLITGWVAIGEGELVTALLLIGYGVEATLAIGIGVLLLAINSIFLTILHQFFLGGIPWDIAGFVLLGCAFGARLAPFISQKISPRKLKLIFATIAIGDGVMFILQYLSTK